MAYDAYDKRLESLVLETVTLWEPALAKLSDDDKRWLSAAVHAAPEKVSNIAYERQHTGFARIITVTSADVERLYLDKVAS